MSVKPGLHFREALGFCTLKATHPIFHLYFEKRIRQSECRTLDEAIFKYLHSNTILLKTVSELFYLAYRYADFINWVAGK